VETARRGGSAGSHASPFEGGYQQPSW
jgi:hypothetical protein